MSKPPSIPRRFFQWYCDPLLEEQILGDLEEQFEDDYKVLGRRKARIRFTWNVIRFFRRSIIRPVYDRRKFNYYSMFENYFKVSFRNLKRQKVFSIINIIGLAIGISSCVLIAIYVNHELSYDKYHTNYDRIYRVLHSFRSNEDAKLEPTLAPEDFQVWGNAPVGPALINDMSEVEQFCRFKNTGSYLVEVSGKRFQEDAIWFADSTMFEIFDWKLLAGDPETALDNPGAIILTEKLAKKYFGDENPIGRTITLENEQLKITGLLQNLPDNSHFKFDGVMPMSEFEPWNPGIFKWWGYVDFFTYFTIKPETSISSMEAKIPEFLKKYQPDENGYSIAFEPLKDAYLHSEAKRQPGATGSIANIYIFISIAIFILLIACINFMNLSTARSVERAKEVGIRKAIGSQRIALVLQFLVESTLMVVISGTLAAIISWMVLPFLEELAGKQLVVSWLLQPYLILLYCFLLLAVGIASGFYPAWVLSRFKSVAVLKGSFQTSSKGSSLRKMLVTLQFALSILLVASTSIIVSQLDFLQDHEKGYNTEQMLVIDFHWDNRVQNQIEFIKRELLSHPNVKSISASRAVPGDFFPNAGTGIEASSAEMVFKSPAIYEIDDDFVSNFDMEVVAGRAFSKDFPLDTTRSLLVNEAAARLWGYAQPDNIIGKKFSQWGREGKVIGVIKDFNYKSLHQEVEPLTMRHSNGSSNSKLALKLSSTELGETLEELENRWNELVPQRPFLTYFVDDSFNEQYEADQQFETIFSIFAGLAIVIACLGLFGLTIYSTAQRTKEIGIRKVLGASISSLVRIMSLDFLKLYAIAVVLAIPLSIYLMSLWLQDFAYRIALTFDLFVGSVILTLFIAIVTMSFRTIKAATNNPVDSLKDE